MQQIGNYTLGKVLGRGSFGSVQLAQDKRSNEMRVMKLIRKERDGHRDETWRRETFTLTALSDVSGVTKMFEYGSTETHNWIVMEQLSDDLITIVRRNETKMFSKPTSYQIMWQLVKILQDIHAIGIVHTDIKADNLMVSYKNRVRKLVLVDYGLSCWFKDHNQNRTPPAPFDNRCMHLIHTPAKTATGHPHMEAEDLVQVAYLSCSLHQFMPWKDVEAPKMTKMKKKFAKNPKKYLGNHQDLKPIIKMLVKQKHGVEPDYEGILDLLQDMFGSLGGGLASGSLNAFVVAGAINIP